MINACMHPHYLSMMDRWRKWRLCWEGDKEYVDTYLKMYSAREGIQQFQARRESTPPNLYATTQILDIANAIYDRMSEISRTSSSITYQECSEGKYGGVDRNNSNMNYFIGIKVLQELLFMGKVGVYVDAPALQIDNYTNDKYIQPYLYIYRVEQIKSWKKDSYGNLKEVLLVDNVEESSEDSILDIKEVKYYRHYKRLDNDKVLLTVYNEDSNKLLDTILDIPEIPLVIFELPHSLMSKVCDYQISLMNIESSDLSFIFRANFPFFVEKYDYKTEIQSRRAAENPNNSKEGSKESVKGNSNIEMQVGHVTGKRYDKDLDYPEFIAPPTEPIALSMAKQEQIKKDIVILLNKSVQALKANRTSADSKEAEVSHEEQGLSYIGLELTRGEYQIEKYWRSYERIIEEPVILYPTVYTLKNDQTRIAESIELNTLKTSAPSMTFRKVLAKRIVNTLFSGKISNKIIEVINEEIDKSKAPITLDSKEIGIQIEHNMLSPDLAAEMFDYPKGDIELAAKRDAERAARVVQAQINAKNGTNTGQDDNLVKQVQ